MAFAWLCALGLALLFICATETAKLLNCGTFVEGYNNPYITCNADGTSTVYWTLVTEAGVTRYLGSCQGYNNCSSPYSSSTLRVSMYSTFSRIYFPNIGGEFSGNLTCQEVMTDGTVDSDTCEINVVRVQMRGPDVPDGGSSIVYCYNYPSASSTVRWTLVTDSGQTLDLGTCGSVNSCTSPHSSISLTRPYNYRSQVYITNANRNLNGRLSCSYTYGGLILTDTKPMNVYYNRATVVNCSVDISRHNWSAILSCSITQVFSSAGLYEFTVYQYSTAYFEKVFAVRSSNDYIFEGRRSFSNGLTSYVNSSDNQVYYNGSLTYSWRLPHSAVRYTGFRVYVYYGHTVYKSFYVTKTIHVTPPDSPSTNCSELNYIPETGVVPCVCTADSLGSPPGRLLWLLGDTVMATGNYGANQLEFSFGRVGRNLDGMMMTCRLDWVKPTSTGFAGHVAFGPDSVTLQVTHSADVTNSSKVYVISDVTGMRPMSPDMVLWGGECQGQKGFACTLTPSSAAEVDGKTVTCRVTNAANNGHSAEASVIIRLSGQQAGNALSSMPEEDSKDFDWIIVGLAIALGVVVIAFIIVVIVLCRRGRPSTPPQVQDPSQSAEGDNSNTYTSLNLSEITLNKRQQQGVTCPSAVYQDDEEDRVYENTMVVGQGGHM